jgi:hypothetical protein
MYLRATQKAYWRKTKPKLESATLLAVTEPLARSAPGFGTGRHVGATQAFSRFQALRIHFDRHK